MIVAEASRLEAVVGRTYGPFTVNVSPEKVAEYVAATGDDPGRWESHAPPLWASGLLFDAAPVFFADPDVAPYASAVIHSDQRFVWRGPLSIGNLMELTGTVTGVRSRSGMHLVSFEVEAVAGDGSSVTSFSTFVMAAAGDPPDTDERAAEPAFDEQGPNSSLDEVPLPDDGEAVPSLMRSVSRAGLVRYAGATLDFNPIHWDHDVATGVGLPGVVVHGLLMGAWTGQAACRVARGGPHPLAELRLRFRKPLRPAVAAEVVGSVKSHDDETAVLGLTVRSGGVDLVTGEASVFTS